MKKWILIPISFIMFIMILIGCTNKPPQFVELKMLTRVDIEIFNPDGNYEDSFMITDKDTVDDLRKIFKEIKWDPNVDVNMAITEDVRATLFLDYDENMPERLFQYQIWFDEDNGTATIISNSINEGYGYLNKDYAPDFEKLLRNK